MTHPLEPAQFVGRLLLGSALGVVIGLERQRKRSSVGVHTTALVAVGATLFALLEPLLGDTSTVRVIANIVTGVGFLAGGVIFKEGANVRGLNTAATLWSTAAVGALAGVGLKWESAAAALVIVTVNVVLDPVATAINRRARPSKDVETLYVLTAECAESAEQPVRAAIIGAVSKDPRLALTSLGSVAGDGNAIRVRAELRLPVRDDRAIESLANQVSNMADVDSVQWRAADE